MTIIWFTVGKNKYILSISSSSELLCFFLIMSFTFFVSVKFKSDGKSPYCHLTKRIKPLSSQPRNPCPVPGVSWGGYMQNKMPLKSGKGSNNREIIWFTVITLQAVISASEGFIFHQRNVRRANFYLFLETELKWQDAHLLWLLQGCCYYQYLLSQYL